MIQKAVIAAMKLCPHCKKTGSYRRKPVGQFYKCKHCRHRFKEKG
jgi:hypothetical protein